MKRKIWVLTFVYLCVLQTAAAFAPYVRNYARDSYNAASQNWALGQDSQGILYIGNHDGLLEYDGCRWQLHALNGNGVVRSLWIAPDDRVYVGSFEEFGYFERNDFGECCYHSLSAGLDRAQLHNQQIWSIIPYHDRILFQSFGGYYIVTPGGGVTWHKSSGQLFMLYAVGDEIYAQQQHILCRYDGSDFIPADIPGIPGGRINAMVPYRDGAFLITPADGIWKIGPEKQLDRWHNDLDGRLSGLNPNRALLTGDSLLLIGTVTDGLYALDMEGRIVWHVNNGNGLQNNTVLGICEDFEGNIWLALDSGVSMIYDTRRLKINRWPNHNIGSVYDVALSGSWIYVATNQGLFRARYSLSGGTRETDDIMLIPGTEGFVTKLFPTSDGSLLVGHNRKTLLIHPDGQIEKLSDKGGGMCAREIMRGKEHRLIQSGFTTFSIFHPVPGGWQLQRELRGFSNPIQFFEIDEGRTIWAGHTNRGLYRLKVDKDWRQVVSYEYLPSLDGAAPTKIGVFRIRKRLVFTDGKQCYTYDDLSDRIVPYSLLNDHLNDFARAHRIVPVDYDRYWFITERAAALVSFAFENPSILNTVVYRTYGFSLFDNYENIVPVNADQSLLCTFNGIAQLSHIPAGTQRLQPELRLTSAAALSGKNGALPQQLDLTAPSQPATLPADYNSLVFTTGFAVYGEPFSIRYRLQPLDDRWTEASRGRIELIRLPAGNYTLEYKVLGSGDRELSGVPFRFRIRPPLYLSTVAIVCYVLLLIGMMWLINRLARRRAEFRHRKLQERQEREIMELEVRKLSDEISFKSKELASSAMHLIRRSEMLQAIRGELVRQKEALGAQYPNKYFNRLLALIDSNLSSEHEWDVFQTNFDLIHKNFFRNLRLRYPELSAGDLKLCALLRLNLDTKEIADMMNLTVRGVEARRYRIRQKIGLSSQDSLTAFLIDFQ